MDRNNINNFYLTLKNILSGSIPENNDGFSVLAKARFKHYDNLKEILQQDINEILKKYPDFEKEFFNDICNFFKQYVSPTASIYQHTINFQEKGNSDIFGAIPNLYYVKTDYIFQNRLIEFEGYKFYFDVTKTESKKSNERRYFVYEFNNVTKDKTIVFNVLYLETTTSTNTQEILNILHTEGIYIDEKQLKKAFSIFERQPEYDYYINADVKTFLTSEFDKWYCKKIKNTTVCLETIEKLKLTEIVINKIIDYITIFENKLLEIWHRPKIVKNINYVITLDKINNIDIIKKIINHCNIKDQINEWHKLKIIDSDFNVQSLLENSLLGEKINERFKNLPIDTKHFKDLETSILNLFDNLDAVLDGYLIKSENYQALNTILPKFRNKIQTIYIDPPFNLNSKDKFLYRTNYISNCRSNYEHINWTILLNNKLKIAKECLSNTGNMFVKCDYNGNMIIRLLLNNIFGGENFKNEIVINRVSKQNSNMSKLNNNVDYIYFYSKSKASKFNIISKFEKETYNERWHSYDAQGSGKAKIIFGHLFDPPKNRRWIHSDQKIRQLENDGKLRIVCKKCKYIHKSGKWNGCPNCNNLKNVRIEYKLDSLIKKPLDTNWTDIAGYTSLWDFQTENSEKSLARCIKISSDKQDFVMDFFLGSGTTIAVAHKLARKWIGIELGNHFYDIILPRMKKVLFYDQTGISREVKEYKGGGFFVYYELEQFEKELYELNKWQYNLNKI